MQRETLNSALFFRLPESLAAEVSGRARGENIPISELLRRAVRNELEGRKVPPLVANAAIGPGLAAIIAGAGEGDIGSLRHIFEDRLGELLRADPRGLEALLISAESLLIGRMVASRGDPDDVLRFAAALCQAAHVFGQWGRNDLLERLGVEAVAVLEELAERGDDSAAAASAELVRTGPTDLPARVRELQRQANQTAGADDA